MVSTLENRRENVKLNVVLVVVLVLESNSNNTENTTTPNIVRLQNSPYFCVFKYERAVKQKVWNEAENRERDWGETLKTDCPFCIRYFRSNYPLLPATGNSQWLNFDGSCQIMFSTSHSRYSLPRMMNRFLKLSL